MKKPQHFSHSKFFRVIWFDLQHNAYFNDAWIMTRQGINSHSGLMHSLSPRRPRLKSQINQMDLVISFQFLTVLCSHPVICLPPAERGQPLGNRDAVGWGGAVTKASKSLWSRDLSYWNNRNRGRESSHRSTALPHHFWVWDIHCCRTPWCKKKKTKHF